jgi:hypothetical protein
MLFADLHFTGSPITVKAEHDSDIGCYRLVFTGDQDGWGRACIDVDTLTEFHDLLDRITQAVWAVDPADAEIVDAHLEMYSDIVAPGEF